MTKYNKHIKNRPQKARAGLATACLLCGRYKPFIMIRYFISSLILSFGISAIASGLPSETLVTKKNNEALGVRVKELNSGTTEARLYQLIFPKKRNTCAAGRVQTFLLKDSEEISSSSMDYLVGSDNPSILFHMPATGHDMALSIQYCCGTGLAPGCKEMLVIQSVKSIL